MAMLDKEPTYVLYWEKSEVGVLIGGGKKFYTALPGVLAEVRRMVRDMPLIGGQWQFVLRNHLGDEIAI